MLNEIILIGRVGSIEVGETKNGSKMVTISLPLFHSYNSEGRKTEWIQCRAFGKRANIVELAQKGVLVTVKGEIHNPVWEDENGKAKSKAYIVIETLRFLEKKKSETGKSEASTTVLEENEKNDVQSNLNVDDDIDGFLNGL